MSFTSVFSAIALIVALGLLVSMVVGGAVYVLRLRRRGPESVLAGARRRRELRA